MPHYINRRFSVAPMLDCVDCLIVTGLSEAMRTLSGLLAGFFMQSDFQR